MALQLPAQTLKLAAGQDGFAVFALEVHLLLGQLGLLLLQDLYLLLHSAALLQLNKHIRSILCEAMNWCLVPSNYISMYKQTSLLDQLLIVW